MGKAQDKVHVGSAHHQVAGPDIPSPDGLPKDVVGGDILRIRELSEGKTAVVQFRAGFVQGVADQVGHHDLPRNDGIDGQEDTASFLDGGPGLRRLAVDHSRPEPADEHGVRHLHAHMAAARRFAGFRDGHVREIGHRNRLVMTRDEAQSPLRQQQQHHNQQHGQEKIPRNPVGQHALHLRRRFICSFLCHSNNPFNLQS